MKNAAVLGGAISLLMLVGSAKAKAKATPAARAPSSPPKLPAKPLGAPPAPTKPVNPAAVKPATKPLGKAVAAKPKPTTRPGGGLASAKPATGAPSVPASPVLEPGRSSLPAGYSPSKAKSRARAIAAHLAAKGPAGYSRPELKSWQTQAGISADGIYGGSSRGALIFFGVKDPPRPFFKPVATLPYVPPEQRVTAALASK